MQIRSFVFLLIFYISNGASGEICNKHLKALATSQKDFVQCSTMNSVPVGLCIGCEEKYTEMTIAYSQLRSVKNCSEKFFDKDRINIVSTTQSILVGLWTKAYCDDCFSSNNTEEFDGRSSILEECFNNNKKRECVACSLKYQTLNDFYMSLDKRNNGKVCYDLQDSMNRTRSKWSKEFGCCHREFNMLFFLIASGLIALLPFIFYGGLFAWGKRRERNHGVLNEDPEFHSEQPTSSTSSPTQVDAVPLPLPNEAPRPQHENSKKIRHSDSDSELD